MNKHDTPRAISQAEITLKRHCYLVTCGQAVKRGERIATTSISGLGDIHAPVAGTIDHVDPYRIRITADGDETVEPISFNGIAGQELLKALIELGADITAASDIQTLIINGVDEEQGLTARSTLLSTASGTLELGIQALLSIYAPPATYLAAINGSDLLESTRYTKISEQYPAGLDPMVALTVTGKENPDNTLVVGLETVFHIGRIMETGLPVMETMITVDKTSQIFLLGTPVGEIINITGDNIEDRDRIVLGGVLRGSAAASPMQGVTRDTTAITLVKNSAPVAQDSPCVGCGECIRHCPARLDPAMITSYAEFGMYDKAADESVDACFECGLCGFFCIAQRPMLQYIRLAKNELERAKSVAGKEK
ncbi:electron transport complex protein RnfC [Pseudodesulfovibrio nedwellii]|uniref:Electron transport complex protein RnfC n=1 Tax=Pseudodesulfovibrio nedwellii TaxID=2973072 RepID=A0ABN6RZT7_9BACT|nr:4Fe-4S dicluster domain-containing protein [Pseudodesulfovibrio nedwellii]BDQ36194.1 electron transport complex protein RnfC [Pseudodesulfovibrio nedwellii]